jgi:large subunit ribosomal protein L22
METQTAKLNYLRIAPRKTRSVADLIRGLSVNEAEAQLMVQRRRPAKALLKLLRSAVANAKNNKLNEAHLFVKEIRVDGGPMLKRYLPRARGSASPIQKKMSHVTMILSVNPKLKSKYSIIVPKKSKLPPDQGPSGKPRKAPTKPQVERDSTEPKKKGNQNFFRRVFGRKTGMGNNV